MGLTLWKGYFSQGSLCCLIMLNVMHSWILESTAEAQKVPAAEKKPRALFVISWITDYRILAEIVLSIRNEKSCLIEQL